VLLFVGRWLGGKADPGEIRQAMAWGYVPVSFAGVGWIPIALRYGGKPPDDGGGLLLFTVLALTVMVGALWTFTTQIITVAEVQRFSILRAVANIGIPLVSVLILASV
jgi:hypothetical protein